MEGMRLRKRGRRRWRKGKKERMMERKR